MLIEKPYHFIRKQAGFQLIESLVTLFVLTVGILGITALLAVAIRSHQDSLQRNQAFMLAQNIADRVRANLEGKAFYDQSDVANIGTQLESACFSSSGCTPKSMAHTDLYQWEQDIANTLPLGEGIICKDSIPPAKSALADANLRTAILNQCDGSGNIFVIHIFWDKTNDGQHLLKTNPVTGNLDPKTSDGYVQLIFEP